jgi:hypothetical protein
MSLDKVEPLGSMTSAKPAPACSPNTSPPNPPPTVLKRHLDRRAFMVVSRIGEGDVLTVGMVPDAGQDALLPTMHRLNKTRFFLRCAGRTGDARKGEH